MFTILFKKAFTLIELLIVVAIIAILAAIAVPNFLEAQVRSKVSRVKADHRTIGTAMEAYRVDWNHLPPWSMDSSQPRWYYGSPGVFRHLTTPTAYLSGGKVFEDPFIDQKTFGYIWYAFALPEWLKKEVGGCI